MIDELGKLSKLKKEIEDLDMRIIEFGDGVKSTQIKEISVSSSHVNKSIQDKFMELINIWEEKRLEAIEECLKIEEYMNTIDDIDIRRIIRYRFIDMMNWEMIGEKMNMDRTTAYKKLKKYLGNS